jgi:hypothetical protein
MIDAQGMAPAKEWGGFRQRKARKVLHAKKDPAFAGSQKCKTQAG